VLTAAALGALLPLVLLGVVELLPELPHPAAASIPATATAVRVQRTPDVCFRLPTIPTSWW
jgi:hypothetical protein